MPLIFLVAFLRFNFLLCLGHYFTPGFDRSCFRLRLFLLLAAFRFAWFSRLEAGLLFSLLFFAFAGTANASSISLAESLRLRFRQVCQQLSACSQVLLFYRRVSYRLSRR